MTTLTDRYVHAVTRSLPEKDRSAVSAELHELIADLTLARVSNGETETDAEREALVELGSPDALAVKFYDGPRHLIGPRYYLSWRRWTARLLVIIVPIVAALAAFSSWIADASASQAINAFVGAVFATAIQVLFWMTLTYAILERNVPAQDLPPWQPETLPLASGEDRGQVGWSDTIATLVYLGLFALFLVIQHFRSPVRVDGEAIPMLDPQLWDLWIPLLLALLAAEAVFTLVLHNMGSWTWSTAVFNLGLNIAFAGASVWLLLNERVLSPELVRVIDEQTGGTSGQWVPIVMQIVAVVIVMISIWDVIEGFIKAREARKLPSS